MSTAQITDGHHFSISLGRALFSEMFAAALPYTVAKGEFDLTENLRQIARQLAVREKVAGLLEDRNPPQALSRVKNKAVSVWDEHREQVLASLEEVVRIDGDWEVELDSEGSDLLFSEQSLGAEAHVKLIAHGKAVFLNQNIEVPFTVEKRIGAELHLKDIRYDKDSGEVVGQMRDVALKLGEGVFWGLLEDLAAKLLAQQVHRFARVPILKKEHLDGLLRPAMEPLKLAMDVEDLSLDVGEEYMTLKVRFGFTQQQITEGE